MTSGSGRFLTTDEGEPRPGQLGLGSFLDQLEGRVRSVSEAELAGTIYRVAGCPWIDHWIGYYRGRSPGEVEAAIQRYAPHAASAESAADYLTSVGERLKEGIHGWQETGQLPDPGAPGGGPPDLAAATAAAAATPPVAAAAPDLVVARSPADGQALEPGTQTRVGALLGGDLGGVRVHTGQAAQSMARREGARAVTVGSDIAFAADGYAPGTPAGDALIAHEVAHVLQQTRSDGTSAIGDDPALEDEADLAALSMVADVHLPGGAQLAAGVQGRSARVPQRCGSGDVSVPPQAAPRAYAEIVGELKALKSRKQAVLEGKEPETALPGIEERTAAVGAELQRMGVRMETAAILERLDVDPATDLMQVRGQIVRTPAGPVTKDAKLAFQAVLDYVPPGRLVQYAWRWKPKGGEREYQTVAGPRGSADRFDLGSGFWTGQSEVDKSGGMEVVCHVYLGKETKETVRLTTGAIDLTAPHAESYQLRSSQKVAVKDAPVTVEMADWAPRLGEYWLDWDVDGKSVATDRLVLNQRFGQVGTHTVTAHVHRRDEGAFLRAKGKAVASPSIEVVIQDPDEAGKKMLGLMTGEGAPAETKAFGASLDTSISEIERHVAEGGEQRDFWVERLKAQRKRRDRLKESVPDLATASPLPADRANLQAGHAYSGPVKSVLVLPSGGGPQPLNVYLSAWQEGAVWKARLVDMTSADVYTRDGSGATAVLAYEGAFKGWMDSHPYPRGGKVRYELEATGWSLPLEFACKDTAWDTVKAWVDGILSVGGVIVGGLLLLTPEPTGGTKALGYLFIAASVARSGVAIYENLQVGVDPLDSRNVVEGLSILTSLLGVSGSLLRQAGLRTLSPLVYAAGKWTVVASLAGDVGTLVLVSSEAMAQLRAVQADPTKDDAQKNAEWLRVASQLFASAALVFLTNKDLLKQGLRPSDLLKGNRRAGPGAGKALSTGTRIDLALELKKVGDVHNAGRVSSGTIPDGELLDRHAALPWLRTGAAPDVEALGRRLTPEAITAVQDVSVKDVRKAMDALKDDGLFNRLAPSIKSGDRMGTLTAGMGKIEAALSAHPDRVAAMKRVADLQAAGNVAGFPEWVDQTAKRLPPVDTTPSADALRGTQELTGELNAMEALAAEVAGDPSKMVRFTPAPPSVKGTPTPRSFDLAVESRTAPAGTGPERLVEVHTETGVLKGSLELNTGVAHAASKLNLKRTVPPQPKAAAKLDPGSPLPAASKEAAVVANRWPPVDPSRTYHPDGSWDIALPGGKKKTGSVAQDMVRSLNGPGMDDVGVQFLDRVTVVDGGTGIKVFSLVNAVDPASVDGSRHLWSVE